MKPYKNCSKYTQRKEKPCEAEKICYKEKVIKFPTTKEIKQKEFD
jgi:hypothetical protein